MVTIFRLSPAIIPALSMITKDHSVLYIDGTTFDAGVGILMSCRGVTGNSFMPFLREPTEDEKITCQCYSTYSNHLDQECPFPNNLKIWVQNEIVEFAKTQMEDGEGIDFVIINPRHNPPLFFAQIG